MNSVFILCFTVSMQRIVALCETLALHVSADSLILICLILSLTKLDLHHMSDRSVSSARSSVQLFISMVYAAVANRRVCAGAKWKVPYSLPASRFFRCLTGPAEAARNGLRHQVACLYHCNRQVGPGDRASVLLMPLASSRLPLDEQSDCLLPDPPVAFFSFFFFFLVCIRVCVCMSASMY